MDRYGIRDTAINRGKAIAKNSCKCGVCLWGDILLALATLPIIYAGYVALALL